MLLNTANLGSAFTSFNAAFQRGFAGVTPTWQQFATLINSTTEQNLYAWLGQFPQMREWVGDRVVKNMIASNYTLVNKDYEATGQVDRNKFLDDTFGIFSTFFEDMGQTAAQHPDEILYALLAAGASNLCFDGQNFFDTDHPITVDGAASTASNYDATGGGNLWALLDTTRPLKPMIFQKRAPYTFQSFTKMTDESVFMTKKFKYGVDARAVPGFGLWQMAYGSLNTLNATNLDAYMATMIGRKSDENRPLGIKPNLLICGPSNRAAARDLIEKQLVSSGETNPNYKIVDLLVTPYLT